MKKVFLTVTAASLLFVVACKKNSAISKVKSENVAKAVERDANIKGSPVASFDKISYDFGTVKEGDIVETVFKVTNTGQTDLVITNAKATCGCTVPTWPKEAIKPGASADIGVKFNTKGKPNKQTKTITLSTNTLNGNERVNVTGMVLPKKKK